MAAHCIRSPRPWPDHRTRRGRRDRPGGRSYLHRKRVQPVSTTTEPPTEDTTAGTGCDLPWCGAASGSVPSRPVIPVDVLTAHPHNIRADLDLDPAFVASVKAAGILVPLRITIIPDEHGDAAGYRVIDGHRRLAAAIEAGLREVPFDLATDRQGDEAGQYLDMFTAHRHRKGFTRLEEADALFAASEAGANRTRIRKTTGLKPEDVRMALNAAKLDAAARASAAEVAGDRGDELTLEELAILAEFQDDPEDLQRLLNLAVYHDSMEHQAARLRQEREERAQHAQLVASLEASGLAVTEDQPPGALLLTLLKHDGERLTPQTHASCPGRGAYFRPWDLQNPLHYCTDPAQYGHELPGEPAASQPAPTDFGSPAVALGEAPEPGTPAADPAPDEDPAAKERAARAQAEAEAVAAQQRLLIEGNRAWTAAAQVRHQWLAQLFARRTAPREVEVFLAEQLLTMPEVLRRLLGSRRSYNVFASVIGRQTEQVVAVISTVAKGRLPLLALAPIVAAYEHALSVENGNEHTWRDSRWSSCPYVEAGRYFIFLASLGYRLSVIEQAVANGVPYTGDTADSDATPSPDESTAADDPAAVGM